MRMLSTNTKKLSSLQRMKMGRQFVSSSSSTSSTSSSRVKNYVEVASTSSSSPNRPSCSSSSRIFTPSRSRNCTGTTSSWSPRSAAASGFVRSCQRNHGSNTAPNGRRRWSSDPEDQRTWRIKGNGLLSSLVSVGRSYAWGARFAFLSLRRDDRISSASTNRIRKEPNSMKLNLMKNFFPSTWWRRHGFFSLQLFGDDHASMDSEPVEPDNSKSDGFDELNFEDHLLPGLSLCGIGNEGQNRRSEQELWIELLKDPFVYIRNSNMRNVAGTLRTSIWKFYHRHGYWAQRRKQGCNRFTMKKKWKFDLILGQGKRGQDYMLPRASWNCDVSYYRPLKNFCRW
ncbi:unnamed protein product [Amoebophrya sp. A25]|nr:unnamed protein product [Amoebophrya sp. A25]|eukprot:GSA25T00018121001.1